MSESPPEEDLAQIQLMLERVDHACDAFEEAWQRVEKPRIEDYVAAAAEPDRPRLFEELLRLEVEYRAKSEVLTPEDFCRRFPGHDELIHAVLTEMAPCCSRQKTNKPDPPPTSPSDVKPGAPPLIPGYEKLEFLIDGGMGVVYKAWQINPRRHVALKMIRKGHLAGPEDVQRFRLEAQSAADMDHPSIVPIYEVGEYEGQPFFTMKLIEGGNLAQWIKDCKSQIVDFHKQTSGLVAQVARAVHHAHQRGILHRDLKPSNILLQLPDTCPRSAILDLQSAIPMVTDFGLAKRLTEDTGPTLSGAIAGTASYMAPEQALATKRLTTAVDVYGLGAILYELLTGKPPYQAETMLDTLRQVVEKEPVPPRQLQPKVPRDLETICLKCLRKQPEKRYESAQAVAEDLERFLAGKPIHGRRISTWERTLKWARRKPAVAALTGAVILVVGLGLGALLWQGQKSAVALEELETNLSYVNCIALASRYLSTGHPYRAEEFLDLYPSGRRHWEWRYLKRWWRREVVMLRGHENLVRSVAFSPDGTLIATGGDDGTVRLWEPRTGRELRILDRHNTWVRNLAFSGDSRLLAWAGEDMTVRVWDVTHFKVLHTLPGAGNFVAISRDGKQLASTGQSKTVKVWDMKTGELARSPLNHDTGVLCVAFSPDGKWLASGSRDKKPAKIWDLASGLERETFRGPPDPDWVEAVAFSPDGKYVATATRSTARLWNTVRLWDFETGQERNVAGVPTGLCTSVAFSANSEELAATFNRGMVNVWDTRDGKLLFSERRHSSMVSSVAFSPDSESNQLAFARGKEATVERWKARFDPEVRSLHGHTSQARGVAFSPDSNLLAGASYDGTVKVWDATAGQEVLSLNGDIGKLTCVAFNHNGQLLASGSDDGQVKVWLLPSGKVKFTIKVYAAPVTSVAFSPDGQYLATAAHDKTVKLWHAATGKAAGSLEEHPDYVMAIAFSPLGRHLASACDGGTLKIWDMKTRKAILALDDRSITIWSVAFSPDGRRLTSANSDGIVRVWDALSGKELRTLRGHTGMLFSVTFNPQDSQRLASAGLDGTVKIWDSATGQEVLSLSGHEAGVAGVAFSPSGDLLASAGLDGAVKIWDATLENEESRP